MIAGRDYADVVEGVEELAGSDVVVVTDEQHAEDIAVHAPAAVVVVLGDDDMCKAVLARTLFPRARVIGVAGDDAPRLVDAIVLDRGAALECVACIREAGDFVPTTARVGGRGIQAFV